MAQNKMIVTDVDGTLLKDGTLDLDKEYYKEFHRLVQSGYKVVICSGRGFSSLEKLFAPILDELYFIADGGTIIRTGSQVLKLVDMPEELWRGLCRDAEKLREEGCDYFVATPDVGYAKDENSFMYRWMRDSYKVNVQAVDDILGMQDVSVVKLSIFNQEDSLAVCSRWFIPKWQEKAQIVCSGKEWVDCINQDANKGNATIWLQNYLNVDKSNTYVFGDNNNDIPMFEAAEHSYAVANAKEEVRMAASMVIPSYSENGVLGILKQI